MTGKILFPLAALGLVFAVHSATSGKPLSEPAPSQQPARNPFVACVAGAGLVEASTDNITIGAPTAGIVSAVYVQVGDAVAAGQPLFLIDDRAERAAVAVRRAELIAAEKKLERLRLDPRPESISPLEATVKECEVRLEDAKVQLARWESLVQSNAVSQHEVSLKLYAKLVAERTLEHARAALAETKAGTWAPDLEVQEAAVSVARAELERATVDGERLLVRAPVAAKILRLHVRAGELIQPATGAILLGDTERLHVRVSIDEADVPRFHAGARARASVKGLSDPTFSLQFVRTEPYIVPKKSLTGQANERVDTRVLEVIFAIDGKTPCPLFVGQQVDAFIEEKAQ